MHRTARNAKPAARLECRSQKGWRKLRSCLGVEYLIQEALEMMKQNIEKSRELEFAIFW